MEITFPTVVVAGVCVITTIAAIYYFNVSSSSAAKKSSSSSSSPRPYFLNQNASNSTPATAEFIPIKLIQKKSISPDTRIFRFALEHENQILGLPIGQHMSLRATTASGDVVTRSYTPITSDDEIGYVDFVIKVYFKDSHPKFPNGGKMSQHLDSLKIGDTIDVKNVPTGRFHYKGEGEIFLKPLRPTQPPAPISENTTKVKKIGFIAAGTGITPILQVVRAILKNENDKTEMWLLCCNRTEEDVLLREELEEHAKDKRLRVWHTLSQPSSPTSPVMKYSCGRIDEDMMKAYLPPSGDEETAILMCGPPMMVNTHCKPQLQKLGFDSSRIFAF